MPVRTYRIEKLSIVAAFVALAACADNALTKEQACQEQADAWCTAIDRSGNVSCERVYMGHCLDFGSPESAIREDLQQDCLDDIDSSISLVYQVPPQSCTQLWNSF